MAWLLPSVDVQRRVSISRLNGGAAELLLTQLITPIETTARCKIDGDESSAPNAVKGMV